jgi:hypothetical protein
VTIFDSTDPDTTSLAQSLLFIPIIYCMPNETEARADLLSPHLARHSPWNEWLHRIVRTPSTLSSMRSRHTGQVGSSVCPARNKATLPAAILKTAIVQHLKAIVQHLKAIVKQDTLNSFVSVRATKSANQNLSN